MNQNQDKVILKNYIYNVSYRILLIITPLITTPYVSRVLGVEGVGIFSYTSSVAAYFVLFGVLGMNMYGQREVAYVRDERQERSKFFWELTCLRFVTCSMALIAYSTIAYFEDYRGIAYIWTISIWANLIDVSWYFYGMEKFKEITIRNIIVKLVGIVAIFLFVHKKSDLARYTFISVSTMLAGNLILWRSIVGQIDFIKPNRKKITSHIKPVMIIFLPQAVDSVYMVLDKIMLGQLSTIEQVGLYSQADKILKLFVTIITSMGLVVSPRIAQNFQSNNQKEIKAYIEKSFEFVFVLALPIMFGMSAVSNSFVKIFFGKGYEDVGVLLIFLSPIVILMGANSIMGWQYLISVKKERELLVTTTIGAVSNCILNLLMIPRMDAIGAVVASVISMVLMVIENVIIMRNVLDCNKLLFLSWRPLLAAVLMYMVVKQIIDRCGSSIIGLIGAIVFGAAMYLVTNILLKEQMIVHYVGLIGRKIRGSGA